MKNLLLPAVLTILLGAACTNISDDSLPSNDVSGVITNGDWEVSYFWDKTKDETHKFSGYSFVFENGGVLRSIRQGSTTVGTWVQGSGKLILFAGAADPLEELNDDWIIVERTETLIRLRDDNDEHVEELHFRKR
ncbi:MAG TPA: hypothetical protein PK198_20965 [Saprospiraceae bacterium]|jgi:hypothetical protein|nr:hypothetical protein [Saprospiraceae bacterium]HRF41282.1 hypothetical protein [Saprospiraceae bacterium]HRJ16457.1 hypothetical protein [Saprospiraceae bacterium]HRK80082.1 hypothetical protein [Saprospiraceae bacterium]